MIHCECRKSRPDTNWRSRVLVSEGRKGSRMSSRRVLRSCSRKSITRKTLCMAGWWGRAPKGPMVNLVHLVLFGAEGEMCGVMEEGIGYQAYSSILLPMTTSRRYTTF